MTIGIVLAATFIAAGLVVAYSLCKVAGDADDWADLHDLFDDGGEPYDPDDVA